MLRRPLTHIGLVLGIFLAKKGEVNLQLERKVVRKKGRKSNLKRNLLHPKFA